YRIEIGHLIDPNARVTQIFRKRSDHRSAATVADQMDWYIQPDLAVLLVSQQVVSNRLRHSTGRNPRKNVHTGPIQFDDGLPIVVIVRRGEPVWPRVVSDVVWIDVRRRLVS